MVVIMIMIMVMDIIIIITIVLIIIIPFFLWLVFPSFFLSFVRSFVRAVAVLLSLLSVLFFPARTLAPVRRVAQVRSTWLRVRLRYAQLLHTSFSFPGITFGRPGSQFGSPGDPFRITFGLPGSHFAPPGTPEASPKDTQRPSGDHGATQTSPQGGIIDLDP